MSNESLILSAMESLEQAPETNYSAPQNNIGADVFKAPKYEKPKVAPTGWGETIGAFYRRNDPLYNLFKNTSDSFDLLKEFHQEENSLFGAEPFNPMPLLPNTPPHMWANLSTSISEKEFYRRMASMQIDDEDAQSLDAAPWYKTLGAGAITGIGNPFYQIGFQSIGGINLLKAGLQSAVSGAAAGVISEMATEGILLSTQEQRELSESLTNIGIAGIAGAIFGGLGSTIKSTRYPIYKQMLEAQMEGRVAHMSFEPGNANKVKGFNIYDKSGTLVDSIDLHNEQLLGLNSKGKYSAASPFIWFAGKATQNPIIKTLTSRSAVASRFINGWLEHSMDVVGNVVHGQNMPLSVQTKIRSWDKKIYDANKLIVHGYQEYLGQMPGMNLKNIMSAFFKPPEGMLTFGQFLEQLYLPVVTGKVHENAIVQRISKQLDETVFKTNTQALVDVGKLPPGIKPQAAAGHISRMYNVPYMEANSTKVKDWFFEQFQETRGRILNETQTLRGLEEKLTLIKNGLEVATATEKVILDKQLKNLKKARLKEKNRLYALKESGHYDDLDAAMVVGEKGMEPKDRLRLAQLRKPIKQMKSKIKDAEAKVRASKLEQESKLINETTKRLKSWEKKLIEHNKKYKENGNVVGFESAFERTTRERDQLINQTNELRAKMLEETKELDAKARQKLEKISELLEGLPRANTHPIIENYHLLPEHWRMKEIKNPFLKKLTHKLNKEFDSIVDESSKIKQKYLPEMRRLEKETVTLNGKINKLTENVDLENLIESRAKARERIEINIFEARKRLTELKEEFGNEKIAKELEDAKRALKEYRADLVAKRDAEILPKHFFKGNFLRKPNKGTLSFRTWQDDAALRIAAEDMFNNITGLSEATFVDQMLGFSGGGTGQGFLKPRTNMISDEKLYGSGIMITDIRKNIQAATSRTARVVEIAKYMQTNGLEVEGQSYLKSLAQAVQAEYSILELKEADYFKKLKEGKTGAALEEIEKAEQKASKNLKKEQRSVQNTLSDSFIRLAGTNQVKFKKIARVARFSNDWANATQLGALATLIFQDIMAPIFRSGALNWAATGPINFISNLVTLNGKNNKLLREQAADFHLGTQKEMAFYSQAFNVASDMDLPLNPLEQFARKLPTAMGMISGATPLSDIAERWASTATISQRVRNMRQLLDGSISKNDAIQLRTIGLGDKEIATDLLKYIDKHGDVFFGGATYVNLPEWTKGLEGEELARAMKARVYFTQAIQKEVKSTNFSGMNPASYPSGLPLNSISSAILPYMGWIFNAQANYMIPLFQRFDPNKVLGFFAMSSMAALSGPLRELADGREPNLDPGHLVKTGILGGGFLGVAGDVFNKVNTVGKIFPDAMVDRYERKGLELFSPITGLLQTGAKTAGMAVNLEFNKKDLENAIFALPLVKAIEFRRIVKQLIDSLNIPETRQQAANQGE